MPKSNKELREENSELTEALETAHEVISDALYPDAGADNGDGDEDEEE